MAWTLAVSGAINVTAAFVFALVGWRLARRQVHGPARLAHRLFIAWWLGVGLYTLAGGALSLAAAAGVTHLGVHIALRYATWVLISAAAFGLMYYLAYLFSGNRRWLAPLAAFYSLIAIGLVREAYTSRPVGVDVMRWRVDLVYADPLGSTFQLILILIALPIIGGALAYFALVFRVPGREQRYRASLVSWSIVAWVLAGLLSRLAEDDWWQLLTRGVLGLVAALVILAAYEPPARVRRWIERPATAGGDE